MIFVLITSLVMANDPSSAGQLKAGPPSKSNGKTMPLFPMPLSSSHDLNTIVIENGFTTTAPPALLGYIVRAINIERKGEDSRDDRPRELLELIDENGRFKPAVWKADQNDGEVHFHIGKVNDWDPARQRGLHGTWSRQGRLNSLEWVSVEPYIATNEWRLYSLSDIRLDLLAQRITITRGKGITIYIGKCADLKIEIAMSDDMTVTRLEVSLGYFPVRDESYRVGYDFASCRWTSIHRQTFDDFDVWGELFWSLLKWRADHTCPKTY